MGRPQQRRPALVRAFLERLRELREALELCDEFMSHSFLRTSLLFTYSDATNAANVHMIDLSRVSDAKQALTHRAAWAPGNHEDGYLTGLDNITRILAGLVDAQDGS